MRSNQAEIGLFWAGITMAAAGLTALPGCNFDEQAVFGNRPKEQQVDEGNYYSSGSSSSRPSTCTTSVEVLSESRSFSVPGGGCAVPRESVASAWAQTDGSIDVWVWEMWDHHYPEVTELTLSKYGYSLGSYRYEPLTYQCATATETSVQVSTSDFQFVAPTSTSTSTSTSGGITVASEALAETVSEEPTEAIEPSSVASDAKIARGMRQYRCKPDTTSRTSSDKRESSDIWYEVKRFSMKNETCESRVTYVYSERSDSCDSSVEDLNDKGIFPLEETYFPMGVYVESPGV